MLPLAARLAVGMVEEGGVIERARLEVRGVVVNTKGAHSQTGNHSEKPRRELLYVCMHTVLVCSMLLTVNLPNKSGKYTLNGVKIREVEPFAVVSTYEKIDSAGLTDSTRYRTSLHNF